MDITTLDILSIIGVWLAGIGTVEAVITSLYLARRDSRVSLKVSVGHRIMLGPGIEKPPEYCSIYIVNQGFRKATITNIGWKVGFFRKQYAIQQIDGNAYSSPLPVELTDGQEAKYLIPFKNRTGQDHWIDEFPKGFLDKWPRLKARTLRLQVFTYVGKTFEAKLEEGLIEKLVESAERHLTSGGTGRS